VNAPYYQDSHATIYQGDCLRFLADMPSASVDAVVTDPPYSSGGMVRSDRMSKTGAKYTSSDSANQSLSDFSGDNRDQRAYAYWMALWLSEAARVTKPGGICMLFTDWRQLPSTTDALQSGGWVWRGLIPWVKPSARPMAGRFTNQAEYVVWGSQGSMGLDFEQPTFPGFYQASPPRDREHITQKPLDVMRQMLQIVPEGGTVLDPFLGSGTTAVAALNEGRNVIGCELQADFAEISARRVREAQFKEAATLTSSPLDFGSLETPVLRMVPALDEVRSSGWSGGVA
jgi:site-specific DNA-methyltransferase (adenine-specific)